jgi:hypothetical protein
MFYMQKVAFIPIINLKQQMLMREYYNYVLCTSRDKGQHVWCITACTITSDPLLVQTKI